MPVETLRPGLVQDADDAGDVIDYPSAPTIVGDPTVLWRDDDPATYADATFEWTTTSSATIMPTRVDVVRAPLDSLSVDSSRATLNSVTVTIDGLQLGSTSPDSSSGGNLGISLIDVTTYTSTYGYVTWSGAALLNSVNSGTTTYTSGWDLRHPDTGVVFTAAEVLDFLASGNIVVHASTSDRTSVPGTYSTSGRFYDVTVTVDYTLIGAPAPLRLYPRNNATRLYPRRRTRRPGTF